MHCRYVAPPRVYLLQLQAGIPDGPLKKKVTRECVIFNYNQGFHTWPAYLLLELVARGPVKLDARAPTELDARAPFEMVSRPPAIGC